MNWDLSSYFPAFDGPEMRRFKQELERDLDALEQEAASLAPLDGGNTGSWAAVFARAEELLSRLSHLGSYLGCLTAADAANEAYKKEEAAFALIEARSEKLDVELQRGLAPAGEAEFSALLEAPGLAGCAHFLTRVREQGRRTMAPGEERVAADLSVDGLHAWGRLYDTLSGKLEFDMAWPDGRGERLPMSRRRALTGHPDRAVRQAAFEGGNRAWAEVEDVAAAALNAIAGTRLTLNRHRGIDHFLDVALFQAATSRKSLDAMFEAIFDASELPRRVLRLKADAMGTDGVAWYDLEAPLPLENGTPSEISWAEGGELVTSAFAGAYPELGRFTRGLVDSAWIEWEQRAGKRPGAFCTGSLLTRESRIYMTWNDSGNDVRTLAHEAGHAFHSHVMREVRPLARQYPMTLAESASTFAEMILTEGLLSDPGIGDVEKARILDMETAHAAVYLTDIPVRYEFEKRFHEERSEGEVAVSRLKELMASTQRELFGGLLIEGGEDPLFWASKLHFYITGVTFYNFPYTYGFLLSRGLFARFREEGAGFLPRYEEFLRMTGSAAAEEVARSTVGCDLESPDFWGGAIETLREPVEQLEALLPRLLAGSAGRRANEDAEAPGF